MTQKHFVLVTLNSDSARIAEKVRGALDKAIDWVEIAPNSWLLWTSSSSKRWLDRIQTIGLGKAQLFIAEVNPSDRAGMMPEDVWQFMRRRQSAPNPTGDTRRAANH